MNEVIVFGDAEAAVIDILRAAPNLAGFGATISTTLIGWNPPARWIRVVRSGGTPVNWLALDAPRITIDAFAENKSAAQDMAQNARGAVFARIGNYIGNGLRLANVTDAMGLAWLHDPNEPRAARYVFALDLITQPA